MRKIALTILLFSLVVPASSVSAALITYSYEGKSWDQMIINNFDSFFIDPYLESTQRLTTGSVTVDSSLLDNGIIDSEIFFRGNAYDGKNVGLENFQFFDGVTTWNPGDVIGEWIFSLKTDGYGDVTDWYVRLSTGPVVDLDLSSGTTDWSNRTGDWIWTVDDLDIYSFAPGTWTKVSEPGALVLLSLGLATLMFLTRRRSNRADYY